ncbi:OmpP1/FadL/TodX family outer membrane transporter [Haloferula helveola]|uniref:OmpP1/FadL/TodX family outer membrane transporter n=1 Tax=Haloferula helveola TaxID=490095 RepID=A0ABN6HD24_9BACT|nr:OmpP1/FadL/TodX family outer membrane transporter [Haloferula helveola]
MKTPLPLALSVSLLLIPTADATGLFRNGSGARSTGLAGTSVAGAEGPLGAMWGNPAALTRIDQPTFELGYFGAYAHGDFTNAVNGSVGIDTHDGHGAEIAYAHPFASGRGTLGFSVIPETALLGDWSYIDAPGGLDGTVSYGFQRHRSEFVAVRTAVGIGWKVTDRLSIGGSAGLVYDRIELTVPFIFQSTPGVAGFKTLLDLETEGFSGNADIGLLYQVTDDIDFGIRYRTTTTLSSEGTATGNASAQLAALGAMLPRTDFGYQAKVALRLPDILSAGLVWRACDDFRLMFQTDWIPWSDHFERMRVQLAGGTNPGLGLPNAVDYVPLSWKDRFTYRLGAEYDLGACWQLRAGYIYSPSAISTAYVTPLNGAIAEHTATVGVGYRQPAWSVDFGYQLDFRSTEKVGTSGYRAGEYSNSKLSLLTHWWVLSGTCRF